MATATVTGTLSKSSLAVISGRGARLLFKPDRPTTQGGHVIATDPVLATLNDTTGVFSAQLVPSDSTLPPVRYTATIQYDGYMGFDLFTDLSVPAGGGEVSDMLAANVPPGSILWGFGPPAITYTNVLYIDINTGTLYGPENGAA